MTELGITSGLFRVDCTQDVAKDLTKEKLDSYDIVFFYTTGDLPIDPEVRDYLFTQWVKQKGHGFIGTHSAADTYHNYEPYWEMLGGTFDGHPWGSGETVTITVHDQDHPVSKPWGPEFTIKDEIYKFKHWQPEKVPRADEPEHGQVQTEASLSCAHRLGEELWRRPRAAHEPGPQRVGLGESDLPGLTVGGRPLDSGDSSRATPRRIPKFRPRSKRRPKKTTPPRRNRLQK